MNDLEEEFQLTLFRIYTAGYKDGLSEAIANKALTPKPTSDYPPRAYRATHEPGTEVLDGEETWAEMKAREAREGCISL